MYAFSILAITMSVPPPALLEHQRWAELAIAHVKGKHEPGALLFQPTCIGASSMFSGTCFPERALSYLDAARRQAFPELGDLAEAWLRPWWGDTGAVDRSVILSTAPKLGQLVIVMPCF